MLASEKVSLCHKIFHCSIRSRKETGRKGKILSRWKYYELESLVSISILLLTASLHWVKVIINLLWKTFVSWNKSSINLFKVNVFKTRFFLRFMVIKLLSCSCHITCHNFSSKIEECDSKKHEFCSKMGLNVWL